MALNSRRTGPRAPARKPVVGLPPSIHALVGGVCVAEAEQLVDEGPQEVEAQDHAQRGEHDAGGLRGDGGEPGLSSAGLALDNGGGAARGLPSLGRDFCVVSSDADTMILRPPRRRRCRRDRFRGPLDPRRPVNPSGSRTPACAAASGRAASPSPPSRAGPGRPACRAAPRSAGGPRCRRPQPLAPRADHDALLAGALDVEGRVDVEQRPVAGRSSRGSISSTTTAMECGSSSRTPSSAASRTSSATRISSGSSVRSPSG